MRLNKFTCWLITAMLLYVPIGSFAWGMNGHRIVAEIASSYLNAKAKKEIIKILGTESLAMASTWADFIKSDPAYDYLSSWHYMNTDDNLNYSAFAARQKKDTLTDGYTKLNFLITQFKNKKIPADKKLLYLRLLIHIVGDLHQPMHVSRKADEGGNNIHVMWFNTESNLHRVWDEELIDYQKLSFTEYTAAINHTTAAQRSAWQNMTLDQWLFESYQISQQLYAEITKPGQKLGFRYNFDHIQTLNTQLLKGGVRLAGLLNSIFGIA